MKARVKATGEIVEVAHHPLGYYVTNNYGEVMWHDEQNNKTYAESELEFENSNNTPDYWTRLEHQYAGMAMLGMLSNEYTHKLYLDNKNYPNGLLNDSIAIAHALIQKLKEKEERK